MKVKAITLREQGEPSVFRFEEIECSLPGPFEIRIEVKAFALNRADTLFRNGTYPLPSNPFVLGAEVSGFVDSVGEKVTRWKKGERLSALMPFGGYTQMINVPEQLCFRLPDCLSVVESAAVPEVFVTAYQLLRWIAKTKPGDTVLIHAGASGVGTAAIQLAKAMGLRVIATSRSPKKLNACKSLGADFALSVDKDKFCENIKKLTGGLSVDVVLDCVGKPYINENLNSLLPEGTLVLYGGLGGEIMEMDAGPLLDKWLHVVGTTFQPRSLEYKNRLINEMVEFTTPLFKQGKIRPVIQETFKFDDIAKAHRLLESNETVGKVVLET